MLKTNTRHPFPDAAFVDKIALQAPDLLVEEIVGLMDETNGDICDDLGRASVAELAEIAVIRIRLRREPPNKQGFPAVFFPQPLLS